ncbi:Organic cation/carnitine transporter 6 [Arabidopsis thaliana]|uniref:OCT6 n=2 Tax=Arabidopsis TaxID=3701 RepID=A0A178WLM8_ARATH|nr:Major facilitator superfamily domain [Arabidopsis thaliana x Arabidopsis arenosa]OAP19208.1 OCT6 [Arabidopsis thaliana]
MADQISEPLLSHLTDDSGVNDKTRSEALTFDKIVEQSLSDFGFWQFFQISLVGLALLFDAQQIFITVYTDAYPTWHCLNHTICDPSASDICKLPRSAWEWDGGSQGKSVISEFGLECSSSLLRGMPSSAFYIGAIVGGFFLALIPDDSLGRKKLVLFSTFAMSITSISVIFSTNVWIYTFLKFIIGFSRSQTWSYALVLISERVSTRWRPRATMIPFTLFVLGFMSLSGIAFLAQDSSWRYLYLYTSGPAVFYCIFLYLFALESPRWLHMQGKDKEAIDVLSKMSPKEKVYLESVVSKLPLEQENFEKVPTYSIKDFFFRKWAFRRILVVMIIMFGLGISYYGVPLAARDIDVNIYLSETLNAVVELPTFIITPILLERFNRRSSVLVNTLLGGASGVLCFVLSILGKTEIAFAFELGTFFCARIGFNLMAVFMVEMFPTCVRSSATMMFRQALVVGGACCPLIASIGRYIPSVSFAIFGIAMSGLGMFVLILPETKGLSLCDSMEEQEKRDQAVNTSHVC